MVFQSTLPARGATPFREANELDVLTFQSTLPARGATNLKLGYGGTQKISIHAPRTGSNRTSSSIFPGRPHFNPRSPHGERRKVLANWDNDLIISIHAPRTGSDRNMAVRAYPEKIFQSTLPARGATRSATRSSSSLTFQSTLPARGATGTNVQMQSVKAISIHAPCTGSDYVEPSGLAVHTNFNPRSPHGERPAGSPPAMVSASYFNPRSPHGERHSSAPANTSPPGISIHAPRTGSDYTALLPPSSQWISIHAPRTGSDVCDSVLNSVDSLFQSTLPARGATFGILRCVADLKSFQSTLPARGATAGAGIFQPARIFQSTLPARGATMRKNCYCWNCFISIHAPRTGSDIIDALTAR